MTTTTGDVSRGSQSQSRLEPDQQEQSNDPPRGGMLLLLSTGCGRDRHPPPAAPRDGRPMINKRSS